MCPRPIPWRGAATAIYAQQAISENTRLERVKLTRELIRQYGAQRVEDAVSRSIDPVPQTTYGDTEFDADVACILTFLDGCAMLRETNSVDRELLFQFLAVRIVDAWDALQAVFPRIYRRTGTSAADFEELRKFAVDARSYRAHGTTP